MKAVGLQRTSFPWLLSSCPTLPSFTICFRDTWNSLINPESAFHYQRGLKWTFHYWHFWFGTYFLFETQLLCFVPHLFVFWPYIYFAFRFLEYDSLVCSWSSILVDANSLCYRLLCATSSTSWVLPRHQSWVVLRLLTQCQGRFTTTMQPTPTLKKILSSLKGLFSLERTKQEVFLPVIKLRVSVMVGGKWKKFFYEIDGIWETFIFSQFLSLCTVDALMVLHWRAFTGMENCKTLTG